MNHAETTPWICLLLLSVLAGANDAASGTIVAEPRSQGRIEIPCVSSALFAPLREKCLPSAPLQLRRR